jgi:hypothetical protein
VPHPLLRVARSIVTPFPGEHSSAFLASSEPDRDDRDGASSIRSPHVDHQEGAPHSPGRMHAIFPSTRSAPSGFFGSCVRWIARSPNRRLRAGILPLALVLIAAGGCDSAVGGLGARASDEWTRSYPLSAHGELQITSGNGEIIIEGVDGSTVDVRAERVVRAATEALAKDVLPRVVIKEDATPDRVALETERLAGITVGVSVQVNYHVRAPRSALVRARTTNGRVSIEGINGRVFVATTNGAIEGRGLDGGVDARATNGKITLDLRAVHDDPIDVRTTNGSVDIALPADTKANVSANCVNGTVDLSALPFEPIGEQSKRRTRGRLNGGGTPIEVSTVNGRVLFAAR